MINRIKARLIKYTGWEKGQALISVLVFLLIGSLILPPVLSHIGTSLKTGRIYEEKTDELYTADSGIEDALWLIKYDRLEQFFTDPEYDIYDFGTTWTYALSDPLNSLTANVSIENVWMPKDVSPLTPTQGRNIIESSKLMIAGTVAGETQYKIKINFYPDEGEEDDLMVESLGIWLPLGFEYNVEEPSSLEDDPFADYYSVPDVVPYAGGQAVVWDFSSVPFESFPGVDPESMPLTTEVTFEFTSSQSGVSPAAISWIETSGVSDVPLSWDADNKVYRITSKAGETDVEAYTVKCGLRKLGSAIEGDYRAVGNSLMIDTHPDSYDIRDELLDESDAEVTDITSDAEVIAAFLYWSGWFAEGIPEVTWEDDCSDYGDWDNPANDWGLSSGSFRGHHLGSAPDWHRYLEMKNSLDLDGFDYGEVRVSWWQWEEAGYQLESDDALRFQFSGDGGETWSGMYTAFSNDIGSTPHYFSYTVPAAYLTDNFKFRFYLQNFGGSEENCYIDDFAITNTIVAADDSVMFKINGTQVYLDGEGDPVEGDGEITASESSVLENEPGEYSYACYRDVTRLVKEYSNLGEHENHTGNGEYTVGGVYAETGNQWSYAGWSLIIIYSSSETAGHQLYLYDEFVYSDCDSYHTINVDFDNDGEPGGTITGFIVPEPIGGEEYAATLTCFVGEGDECWAPDSLKFNDEYLFNDESPWNNVWNSQSPGMSEDGVDIDTFSVTWSSGLLEPGDSSAQLDLLTRDDSWNLVYIILSLRSETVTGGTVHYVIRN